MKLHGYLEEVLGSAIKIRVLRMLFKFPTRGFGIRELARFIGANHRPVASTIRILRDNNMVTLRVVGRSYLVYLNKESFLATELAPLFSIEINSPASLIELIRSHLPLKSIKLCALFGSVAEGKEKPNSDIDLLIITSHKGKVSAAIAALQEKTLYSLGNPLSVLVLSPREFQATNPALKENIMRNHVLIHGTW